MRFFRYLAEPTTQLAQCSLMLIAWRIVELGERLDKLSRAARRCLDDSAWVLFRGDELKLPYKHGISYKVCEHDSWPDTTISPFDVYRIDTILQQCLRTNSADRQGRMMFCPDLGLCIQHGAQATTCKRCDGSKTWSKTSA